MRGRPDLHHAHPEFLVDTATIAQCPHCLHLVVITNPHDPRSLPELLRRLHAHNCADIQPPYVIARPQQD